MNSRQEKGILSGSFQPHVEYFRNGETIRLNLSPDYRQKFADIFECIYPEDVISRLKQDNYNPYILGYDHPQDQSDLPTIQARLHSWQQGSQKQLKVAFEIIPPIQLQYIKNFLIAEEEFKRTGSIGGIEQPKTFSEDYRRKLARYQAEQLALWLLENGFDVVPLEHADVQSWIAEDQKLYSVEESFFGETEPVEREFYTSIRRDANGIRVLDQERPDIICTGVTHAIKYDLLLGRNGNESYYVLERPLNWEKMLDAERTVHNRYKREAKENQK